MVFKSIIYAAITIRKKFSKHNDTIVPDGANSVSFAIVVSLKLF